MVDFVTKSVNSRMITAFFDTREAAQRASDSLVALGVRSHAIQITDGASDPQATAQPAETGFWESLKNMFLPADDHHSYAEGLRRGGYLLSANVEPELYDRAAEVLNSGDAINMDEREATWRSSGWAGYTADAPGMATGTAIGAAEGMADPTLATLPTEADGGIAGYDSSRFAKRDTGVVSQRLRTYTMDEPIAPFSAERFSPVNDSGRIAEHMDVIASDGAKIGTVDHLDGDQIKLTKSASPDGMHHFIPLADIDHVDAHVHLNRTAAEARASW